MILIKIQYPFNTTHKGPQMPMDKCCKKRLSLAIGLVIFSLLPISSQASDEDIELAQLMGQLQRYLHKTGLSIDGKNEKLTQFYLHELEEAIETLEKVKTYDGFKIGKLTQSMLTPSFESFEEQSKQSDFNKTHKAYKQLIQTCNACHSLTNHAYIVIEHNPHNPYLQKFAQ